MGKKKDSKKSKKEILKKENKPKKKDLKKQSKKKAKSAPCDLKTLLVSCNHQYEILKEQPLSFDTVQLYPSEYGMLLLLKDISPVNLTQLAGHLNISKSGTAKTAQKLISKNLILKEKSQTSSREVVFTLTPLGMKIADLIPKKQSQIFSPIDAMIEKIDVKDARILEGFFSNLMDLLDESLQIEKKA